jgi:FkbM family methyltransferase
MARFLWGPEQKLIMPTPKPVFLMNEDESGLCQMFRVGIPEHQLIEFCRQFGDKTKRFVDGGAHMGAYSILLADEFAQVDAFEAQRRTFMQLCGNIFLNEKDNIKARNLALTSHEDTYGDMTLYIVSDDGGGSTLIKPEDGQIKAKETVETIHIDNYEWDDVGLIKLDVEGAEKKAIDGARLTIKRSGYPPILFESNGPGAHNQKRAELFNYVKDSFGYAIAAIRGFDNMFIAARREAE